MSQVLPSTFKMMDQTFPLIDDRHCAVYFLRHFSIPFTIVADLIIGIAHLIFLGAKQELTQKDFWEISHEYFFVYPFQQIIYFLFATAGALMEGDYFEGYVAGQAGVMNVSNETYQGSQKIFAQLVADYKHPQYFPDITLTRSDLDHLAKLVEHTARFSDYQQKLKDGNHENRVTKATCVYQLFYDKIPTVLYKFEENYQKQLQGVPKGCSEHLEWTKNALKEGKGALEAFFALPLRVRVRLTERM